MTVHIDLIDGSGGQRDERGWVSVDRIAKISGLTGSGQAKLNAAYEALEDDGITLNDGGSAHPQLTGLYLTGVRMDATKEIIAATLTYIRRKEDYEAADTDALITVGSALEQQQTNIDVNGDPITVTLGGKTQTGTVMQFIPKTTLRLSRIEHASPANKSALYTGKLNKAKWDVDPSTPARCWLCMAIVGTSRDWGKSYSVDYDFARSPKAWDATDNEEVEMTWDQVAYYVDPATGLPSTSMARVDYSATSGEGWKRPQTQQEADFNKLKLRKSSV